MTHTRIPGACEGGPEFKCSWDCSVGRVPSCWDLGKSLKVPMFKNEVNLVGMTHTGTLGACEGGLEFELVLGCSIRRDPRYHEFRNANKILKKVKTIN